MPIILNFKTDRRENNAVREMSYDWYNVALGYAVGRALERARRKRRKRKKKKQRDSAPARSPTA